MTKTEKQELRSWGYTDADIAVIGKLGKRPKTAQRIAEQLGYASYRAVSRVLGGLNSLGWADRVDGGWVATA